MNPEILNNHLLVSKCAVDFLHYAVTQGRCLKKLDLLDDTLPRFFRNYPYPLHSWPWFISGEMKRMVQECACRVPELVYRAIRKQFSGAPQRFAAFYTIPPVLAEIFLDSGLDLAQVMLRMDAVLTSSGLKIVEINAGPNIGGWQIQWMDRQYRKQPELVPFFEANDCHSKNIPRGYMKHVIERARASGADASGQANVVFIVDKTVLTDDLQDTFRTVFDEALRECGGEGSIDFEPGFESIAFQPTGLSYRGKRLNGLITVQFGTDLAIPHELYRAFLRGQVYWPDNPFVSIIGDKRSLAIVHEHKNSGLFDEDERRVIDDYVPWCATVGKHAIEFEGALHRPDEFLARRRESLVIKAASGAQGNDVYVGKHQSVAAWQDVVDRGLSDGAWLVQEYCASLPFYGQFGTEGFAVYDVIWGVFGFGPEYGGCWLRLMPKDMGDGIINSAKGAQETIVYEVRE